MVETLRHLLLMYHYRQVTTAINFAVDFLVLCWL